MILQIAEFGYALCAAAFTVITGLMAIGRAQSRYKSALMVASSLTAVWSGLVFVRLISDSDALAITVAANVFEQARTLGWMAAVAFVVFFAYGRRFERTFAGVLLGAVSLSTLYLFGFQIWALFIDSAPTAALVRFDYIARVILAVSGLLLVENLFRNSGAEARWAVKTLCFGIGAFLTYDFLLYAEAALNGVMNADFFAARGYVNAIAAPLIVLAAARSKKWPIDLHVSRRLVFHSATLLGAGAYLISISGVSYYLTSASVPWSGSARIVLISGALLVLMMVMASAAIQARVKDFIARNFFSYKYDYRGEWLKFIEATSTSSTQLAIPERIARALANIVESTAGALWIYREEDHAYQPAANWNMGEVLPSFSADEPFITDLKARGGVLNLATREIDGSTTHSVAMLPWLHEHPRAWLAIPLPHGTAMPAFVVLGRSRVPRPLTWEDFELLKTTARQAASYVAEELSTQSLARARRFEDFNRQFAFVVHDLKNLSGQMSLILKNADRHGDNPEFQKDVLDTIRNSADRMHLMLQQLRSGQNQAALLASTELVVLVEKLAAAWRLRGAAIRVDGGHGDLVVRGDAPRISAIIDHLVQNAVDAGGIDKEVTIRVDRAASGAMARLDIVDRGPGMDQKFVDERLFRPLNSTKKTGYGIGAYQAREQARELGGRLTVLTAPGQGTTMTIEIPLVDENAARAVDTAG